MKKNVPNNPAAYGAASNRGSINWIVTSALLIAMTFLATYFTHIPTPLPGGYFNLGDSVILATAILLGRTSGFLVGSIGSCLADIAFGAFIFAPVTFVVKGLEGLVAGVIAHSGSRHREGGISVKRILAVAAGAVVMVGGYFLSEAYILGMIDNSFGIAAAVTELLPNLVQGSISAVVAYILAAILEKAIGKSGIFGYN